MGAFSQCDAKSGMETLSEKEKDEGLLLRKLRREGEGMARWLRFVGGAFFVMALPYAATGYGVLIAWVPVWMGVLLFQAAGALRGREEESLLPFMSKLRRFFVLFGILCIALLVFTLLILALGGPYVASLLEEAGL